MTTNQNHRTRKVRWFSGGDMRFYVFDGECYQLMLDELRDAYQLDSRIPKMIGVSRQAFHAYLQGHMGPKNDRAQVIRSIVPSAFKLVGKVH